MAFILRSSVGNTKHDAQNCFDFVKKIKGITLQHEETIISYDVVDLFTSIPPTSALDVVQQALLKDTTLSNRTNLACNQICDLLHLCLDNTFLSQWSALSALSWLYDGFSSFDNCLKHIYGTI